MAYEMNRQEAYHLVLSGNAVFTIKSEKTQVRYTYKIKKHKTDDVWFVYLLTGRDNMNDYTYIGIFNGYKFYTTKASKLKMTSTPCIAIEYFLKKRKKLPELLRVYHEGRCMRCGRPLTTPDSIEIGLGPECRKIA